MDRPKTTPRRKGPGLSAQSFRRPDAVPRGHKARPIQPAGERPPKASPPTWKDRTAR